MIRNLLGLFNDPVFDLCRWCLLIWIGDDNGHLVQQADGTLKTSLLAGEYTVEFGLGSQCYPIKLSQDLELSQSEIEAGPTCEQPKIKFEE